MRAIGSAAVAIVVLVSAASAIAGNDVLYSQLGPHQMTGGQWWVASVYEDPAPMPQSAIICQDFVPQQDGIVDTIGIGGGRNLTGHDIPQYVTIEIWRPGEWGQTGLPGERLRKWTIPSGDFTFGRDAEDFPILYYDVSDAPLPVYAGQVYQLAVYGDTPDSPFDWTADIGQGPGYFWVSEDNTNTWDGPFDFGVTGPVANMEFVVLGTYDPLLPEVDIYDPFFDDDEPAEVVLGPDEVAISAVEATGNAQIQAAQFGFYAGETFVEVGWDHDGTSPLLNTVDPPGEGDGWSMHFNPQNYGLVEGPYQFVVGMVDYRGIWAYDFFPFYYDPFPPFPTITNLYYENVVNHGDVVQIQVGGGDPGGGSGERVAAQGLRAAGYFVRGVEEKNQHHYGDRNGDGDGDDKGEAGNWYCVPTATASCLKYLAGLGYTGLLDNGNGGQLTQRELVEWLARLMGTRANSGTKVDNWIAGLKAYLKGHGNKFSVGSKSNPKFKDLKSALEIEAKKGEKPWQKVDVLWSIQGAETGHAVTANSMKNEKNKNGRYDVDFMDPWTGTIIKTEMTEGGAIEYPPGSGKWRASQKMITVTPKAPPPGRGGLREEFEFPIGEDIDGSDGFSIPFDTSLVDPGVYFAMVTMTDAMGHSGTDYVMVVIPETTSAPAGLVNAGWNWFSIPNFPLDEDDADPNVIFAPDNVSNKVYRWNPVVKNLELYPDDFDRLEVGRGYTMFASKTLAPSYLGYNQGRSFEILLPEEGWTWIGHPQSFDVPLAGVLIRNEELYEIRTADEDRTAPDPWVNWNILYWDSAVDTVRLLGLSGADDDTMHPWYGYRIWSFTRRTSLIIPGL